MINILNKPIYNDFITSVSNCCDTLMLCAPYIKHEIINDIYTVVKNNVKIKVLTNINIASFINKASDINAIEKIILNKHSVYNYPNLHAKFYIFDNKKLIISSANLTSSGLMKNMEYGIMTDNSDMIKTASSDFRKFCTDELAGRVLPNHIDKINNLIKTITVTSNNYSNINDYIKDDDLLTTKDTLIIKNNLKGWMKSTFEIVSQINKNIFSINDIYNYIPIFKEQYPHNHTIEAKIRQQLQFLRDIGLIKFVSRGIYKKLWE